MSKSGPTGSATFELLVGQDIAASDPENFQWTGKLVAVGTWPAPHIVVHVDGRDRVLMLAHVASLWAR